MILTIIWRCYQSDWFNKWDFQNQIKGLSQKFVFWCPYFLLELVFIVFFLRFCCKIDIYRNRFLAKNSLPNLTWLFGQKWLFGQIYFCQIWNGLLAKMFFWKIWLKRLTYDLQQFSHTIHLFRREFEWICLTS